MNCPYYMATVYTQVCLISFLDLNPPKSPLERGTKIRILAPFPRGLGDLDLRINSNRLVYTR
jgi:hypothetical protein